MSNEVDTVTHVAVRRLETPDALALADLAAIFEDLQTVLRCCERLLSELGATDGPDDLSLESFWPTAVLSYTRCFATRPSGTALTPDDITETGINGDVLGWHKVLVKLREQYADPALQPRDGFSVGAVQDAEGTASGVAVTSAPQPRVDDLTVRQTGAITYGLSRIVDQRIAKRQEVVSAELRPMTKAELDKLPLVEVTSET
jgi:hypothetical protein